ncbi:MAG: hypothetical protein ACOCUS_00140 [Polyangiales bacterium]
MAAIDVILAPDVYVNASVALKSPPEQVVQRVLAKHKGECGISKWILERAQQMLKAIPEFKDEAIKPQLQTIIDHTKLVDEDGQHDPNDWAAALVAAAKSAGVERVVTDHPDLLEKETVDGVEFLSCDAWLVEQTTPPPFEG